MNAFQSVWFRRDMVASAWIATLAAAALALTVIAFSLYSKRQEVVGSPLVSFGALEETPRNQAHVAEFGGRTPSPDVRRVADWIAGSRNNAGNAFVIVDKKHTTLHVFDSNARLIASTPVLIGAARGDDSTPGIASKPMAKVRLKDRTTPAGRFVGEPGHNALGEDVVWVDYDTAVSMHRVRTLNPRERRLERLASPSIEDNRISYGCINVPAAFYDRYIGPMFAANRAPVYVLPEIKSLRQVFGA